jgi:hypothetical protein
MALTDGRTPVEFRAIVPYNDDGQRLRDLITAWRDKIKAIRGLQTESDEYQSYVKYSEYDAVAQEAAARLTPNGYAANVASRLVPRSLVRPGNVTILVNALLKGLDINTAITSIIREIPSLEVVMTTPVHTPDEERSTSVHSA